jgi:hypothetical protein
VTSDAVHEKDTLDRDRTRRDVLRGLASGLGSIALGSLLAPGAEAARGTSRRARNASSG